MLNRGLLGSGPGQTALRAAAGALLVTAALLLLLLPAEAQASETAVGGVTVTSPNPGELVITWDAPTRAPGDYRVTWKKSTAKWPSYKNENTALGGNAFPTERSLTVTDLEEGTAYKVRVRARYLDGDGNVEESGPWSDPPVELTVSSEPPPEEEEEVEGGSDQGGTTNPPTKPTGINYGATHFSVLLTWDDPDDDSITGYQILRGDDEDNLAVLIDDTGDDGTSYDDTTVDVETTYYYALKARNAGGLSRQSETVKVSTEAAQKETSPVVARHFDSLPTWDLADLRLSKSNDCRDDQDQELSEIDDDCLVVISGANPELEFNDVSTEDYNVYIDVNGTRVVDEPSQDEIDQGLDLTFIEGGNVLRVRLVLKGGGFAEDFGSDAFYYEVFYAKQGALGNKLVGNFDTPGVSQYNITSEVYGAQHFRTGSNEDGYELTRVAVDVTQSGSDPTRFSLHENSSSSRPGNKIVYLYGTVDSTGKRWFVPASQTKLEANTSYWIVLGMSSGSVKLRAVTESQIGDPVFPLDSDSQPGWEIRRDVKGSGNSGDTWPTDRTHPFNLAILGRVLEKPTWDLADLRLTKDSDCRDDQDQELSEIDGDCVVVIFGSNRELEFNDVSTEDYNVYIDVNGTRVVDEPSQSEIDDGFGLTFRPGGNVLRVRLARKGGSVVEDFDSDAFYYKVFNTAGATTFFINFGKIKDYDLGMTSTRYIANKFFTGANSGGFQLSHVEVDVTASSSGTARFSLHRGGSAVPGSKIVDLYGSVSSTGRQRFVPASPTKLDANSNYWVVAGVSSGLATLSGTAESGGDSGTLRGWRTENGVSASEDGGSTFPITNFGRFKLAIRGKVLKIPTWDLAGQRLSKSSDCRSAADRMLSEIDDRDCMVIVSGSNPELELNGLSTEDYNVYIDVNGTRVVDEPSQSEIDDGFGLTFRPGGNVLRVRLARKGGSVAESFDSDAFYYKVFSTAGATTFFINFGKIKDYDLEMTSTRYIANKFFTGANSGGFQLSHVEVDVTASSSGTARFSLHRGGSAVPGSKIVDLYGSVSSTGRQRFVPASPTKLDANSNYWVVAGVSSGLATLSGTAESGGDSGTLRGWRTENRVSASEDGGSTFPIINFGRFKLAIRGKVLKIPTWDLAGQRLSKSSDCRSAVDRMLSEIDDRDCMVTVSGSNRELQLNGVSTEDYNVYIDVNGTRVVDEPSQSEIDDGFGLTFRPGGNVLRVRLARKARFVAEDFDSDAFYYRVIANPSWDLADQRLSKSTDCRSAAARTVSEINDDDCIVTLSDLYPKLEFHGVLTADYNVYIDVNGTRVVADPSQAEIDDGFRLTFISGDNVLRVRLARKGGSVAESFGSDAFYYKIPTTGNHAPTADDNTVETFEDTPYPLKAGDFNFSDADGDPLSSVTIVTLPSAGTLALEGAPVEANQSIARSDIDGNKLTFTPELNAHGAGHASFDFKVNDGELDSFLNYTMTIDVTPTQDLVRGKPQIGGNPTVGATLTASTEGISDPDGIDREAFSYQWIRVDGSTETEISGATSRTYTPTGSDSGKRVKVVVSFTDAGGEHESVISGAFPSRGKIAPPDVLVSNLGQKVSSIDAIGLPRFSRTLTGYAVSFTTGSNPAGYRVSQVRLMIAAVDSARPRVSIHSDSSGRPGLSLKMLKNPRDIPVFTQAQYNNDLIVVAERGFGADSLRLDADTTYWLVIERAPGSGGVLFDYTGSQEEDPSSDPGWSIGDGGLHRKDSPTWSNAASNDAPTRFSVNGAITLQVGTPLVQRFEEHEDQDVFDFNPSAGTTYRLSVHPHTPANMDSVIGPVGSATELFVTADSPVLNRSRGEVVFTPGSADPVGITVKGVHGTEGIIRAGEVSFRWATDYTVPGGGGGDPVRALRRRRVHKLGLLPGCHEDHLHCGS